MTIANQSRFVLVASVLLPLLHAGDATAAFGISSVLNATVLPAPPPGGVTPGANEQPVVGFPFASGNPIIFPEVLGGSIVPLPPTAQHPLANIGLDVDHNGSNVSATPVVSGNVVNPVLVSALIPVGTHFNSYLLHFDPLGSPAVGFYDATINFTNPVIGVQLFSNGFALQKPVGTPYQGTLEEGDAQIAANGGPPITYYPGSATFPPLGLNFRGVEEDSFQLTVAGNKVELSGQVFNGEIDQIRILTAAVPEPSSIIAWGLIVPLGCVGLVALRREA